MAVRERQENASWAYKEMFKLRMKPSEGVVIDPDHLFRSHKTSNEGAVRAYYRPNNEGGFDAYKSAYIHRPGELPGTTTYEFSSDQSLSLNLNEPGWRKLNGISGHDSFTALYVPNGRLEILVLEHGQKGDPDYNTLHTVGMGDLPYRKELYEELVKRDIDYDQESGIIKMGLGDKVIHSKDKLDMDTLLDKLFPKDLRDNPFEAGVEHDVWAQVNWMEEFGISWNRMVPVPALSF